MNMVFIDASAWIALYHNRDKYHKSAWLTYEQLLNRSRKFLTTNWVVYEAITILKSRSSYMEREKCSLAFGYDSHFVEATKQYGFTML